MSSPKFCANCGEKLDSEKETDECPKCHSALHQHSEHTVSPSRVVEQLPYKSPGTAALIAFVGGIFALPGIGHIYVGKVGKGIGILVGGLILYILMIVSIVLAMTPLSDYSQYGRTEPLASDVMVYLMVPLIVLSIGYVVLFIWQIFNARKLAKKFNEAVRTTGKEPW